MGLLLPFCLEAESLTGGFYKNCLSLIPIFMIYDEHDSTFRCIWLEIMLAEGEVGGREGGESFSFIFRGH